MSLLLLSMMTLITGFTCPPTIYFKFITKCDKCYYKVRQLFLLQSAIICYYKVRQVLLQSATGITKCDKFITKCDRYYKVRRLLQIATVHTDLLCIHGRHPTLYTVEPPLRLHSLCVPQGGAEDFWGGRKIFGKGRRGFTKILLSCHPPLSGQLLKSRNNCRKEWEIKPLSSG